MIKKVISILIFSIIIVKPAYAIVHKGSVETNLSPYSFNQANEQDFLQKADDYMKSFENSIVKENREYYLKLAMKYYFLAQKINKYSLEAQIGLGRIYDELKQDRLAKKCFFNAYNMDKSNPKMNFYFANYYYKRNDLTTAFHYYDVAYRSGYSNNYYLNYRMGVLSEKLADIEMAKKYYKKAFKLNEKMSDLKKKITSLDNLNYSQSQYYIFNK